MVTVNMLVWIHAFSKLSFNPPNLKIVFETYRINELWYHKSKPLVFGTSLQLCNGETYFLILTSDLEKSGHSNTPEPSALTPTFCGLTSPWTNPCWCNKLRPHVTPRAIFCLLWKPNKLACFKFYTQKFQQQIKNPLIFINKQIFHILISKIPYHQIQAHS